MYFPILLTSWPETKLDTTMPRVIGMTVRPAALAETPDDHHHVDREEKDGTEEGDARDQQRGGIPDDVRPVLEQVEGEDGLRCAPLHEDEHHDAHGGHREEPDAPATSPRDTPGRRG